MSVFDMMDDKAIENFRKAATAAKTKPAAFLKFEGGVWTLSGTDVTDSTWLALPDLASAGHKRFQDKQVVEEIMVLIAEAGIPSRPDTFTDREQWTKGNGGRPMDPWSRQLSLPLLNEHSGKVAAYNAPSVSGKIAIGEILDDFALHRRRQVVTLSSELETVDGRDVHEPKFAIIKHSENDTEIKGFAAEKSVVAPEISAAAKAKANGGTMDDDIPF